MEVDGYEIDRQDLENRDAIDQATDWRRMYREAEVERDALQINHEALTRACLAILPDMPTGFEVAGQDMGTTMRQHRIREWRKATTKSAHDLGLTDGEV